MESCGSMRRKELEFGKAIQQNIITEESDCDYNVEGDTA